MDTQIEAPENFELVCKEVLLKHIKELSEYITPNNSYYLEELDRLRCLVELLLRY